MSSDIKDVSNQILEKLKEGLDANLIELLYLLPSLSSHNFTIQKLDIEAHEIELIHDLFEGIEFVIEAGSNEIVLRDEDGDFAVLSIDALSISTDELCSAISELAGEVSIEASMSWCELVETLQDLEIYSDEESLERLRSFVVDLQNTLLN